MKEDRVEEIRRAKLIAYRSAYDYKVYNQGSIKDVSPDRVIGKSKLEGIRKNYPRQLNEYIETYKGLEKLSSKAYKSKLIRKIFVAGDDFYLEIIPFVVYFMRIQRR